jgi:hypothetical protein
VGADNASTALVDLLPDISDRERDVVAALSRRVRSVGVTRVTARVG